MIKGVEENMKRLCIVLFISCFLLLSNVTIAIGSTPLKVSIKNLSTTTIENTDKPLVEEKIITTEETDTAQPAEESEITDAQESNEPILEIKTVEKTMQPGEQATPGSQYVGIANVGGPYQGQPGTAITFRSKGIVQPGATYEWDFHDKFDSTPGFGTHPTHVYSEADTYWVTLTVTKANGEVYMDMAPVYVGQANNYLVPYGGVSYEGEINEPITFDASLSKSTNPNAYPLKYRWDFGDGEVSQWSSNPQISHTYEKERVYQIKLEIKDKFGKTRYDILHADIGCSFSSYKNFFINTDGVLDELVDILFEDTGSGWIICQWLKPYVYYRYDNGIDVVEDTIQIINFNDFPMDIDFNNDGTDDLHLGTLNLFKAYGATSSPFHDQPSIIQFNTDLADITLQGCVTDSDDITVCLQITVPPIFEELTQLEEPSIRIGFHSEAGKAKPTNFKITHIFRPYLLYFLLNGNSENNEQGTPTQETYYSKYETTTYPYSNPAQQPLPLGYGENTGSTTMGSTTNQDETVQVIAQQTTRLPQGTSEVYPEQEIIIYETGSNGLTGKSFSLIASISDGYDFVPSTTLAITFESMFDTPFILTHRKAEVDTDVNLAGGEDETSSITFSVIRKNSEGNSATLGVLISPVQKLGLHVDINRVENERQVELNIDNPPDTAVVFFETENGDQQDGRYFYMKNIPSHIGLHWVPSLSDGYIELNTGASPNFEIGLCDDLLDPDTRLFITDIPTTMDLSWAIVLDEIRSVTLSSSIEGLTLNGEFKDLTQSNQVIKFRATSQSNLSVNFEWSLLQGYFALDKSDTTIDFDFNLEQDDLLLDVTGDYIGAEGEGIEVRFNSLKQGMLEIDSGKTIDVQINLQKPSSSILMSTGIIFEQDGNMKMEWGEGASYLEMDSKHSIIFTNFNFEAPKLQLSTERFKLATNAHLELNAQSENLLLGGSNSISITNFVSTINRFSASLNDLSTSGSFSISLKPSSKYFMIQTTSALELDNINLAYDDPDPSGQLETEFGLDTFEFKTSGYIWFDFASTTKKFKIEGNNQLSIENLHFSIGTSIDFNIQSFGIGGQGYIYTELYNQPNQKLIVYANVNFNWNIDVQTQNYGKWDINGSFAGYGSMNIQELVLGQSGQVVFTVNTPIQHNLRIIRNDNIIIDLGSLNLNSGSTTIQWQRETSTNNGYLNIINNGVTGTLSLFNIKILGEPNPVEFQVGTINIQPGTLYMDWQIQTNTKMLHINNGLTINLDIIKLKWSGKTITLGDISLKPGQFKVTYDPTTKIVTLKNGMTAFGPICTYEDSERKVSVDLLNLVNDYSKTMTLKWYEDANNKIIGVYLDTDNANLVDWVVFESIKYASNPSDVTGRRIALGGFQADDFKIMKNTNGKLEISGKIYLANHLTYSKLSNYQTNQWKNLELQWNLNLEGIGSIELNADAGFDEDMKFSTTLAGVDITSTFELPQHLKFGWDVNFDGQGYVTIDTNNESIYEIAFEMQKNTTQYHPKWGIYIGAIGLTSEDYQISWNFNNPPGSWVPQPTGYIEPGCLNDIYIAWNGQWYNLLQNGQPSER